ncbi:MAG TPA: copper oxidase [Kofleriaceae bacterium]|nr:copper oxidase [Kofleriaceae bacterium]
MLSTGLAAGGVLVASRVARGQHQGHDHQPPGHEQPAPPAVPAGPRPLSRGRKPPGASYTPVVVPNGWTLPFEKKGDFKVFHLVAEPVKHEIAPGLAIEAWGYNGGTPGPLIEAVAGDRVRIYVENRLPEPTSVHWHGVLVPNGMDGVAGLTQPVIPVGKTFKYEFTFARPGTFMYHPHFDEMTQIALGMVGMIVVHPRGGSGRRVRDYSLMAHEWKIEPGAARPDPLAMNDFNVLTFNSKAFPATEPLVAETGDLVRIRLGNLGPMDHHPIHFHGHTFQVTYTDGGPVPRAARWPETTTLVPVGSVRVIEFVADNPGDWPLHCHMTHHVMNQMGHDAPNLIGADVRGLDQKIGPMVPGYMTMGHTGMSGMEGMPMPRNSISMRGGPGPFGTIDMGGMFTIVKVRDRLAAGKDPGWYSHPRGTVASEASGAELAKDGVGKAPRREKTP